MYLRALDEIIQSGMDPRLKTKSDCLQDALALFVEDWNKNYQDGIQGRTLRMLELERMKRLRESRTSLIEQAQEELQQAVRNSDIETLHRIEGHITAEREDSLGVSPPTYIKELDELLGRLSDMLRNK